MANKIKSNEDADLKAASAAVVDSATDLPLAEDPKGIEEEASLPDDKNAFDEDDDVEGEDFRDLGRDGEMHYPGDMRADDESTTYREPGALDAPDARAGYVQRWVRINLVGAPDTRNRARQNQQGWRPRSKNTVPDGVRNRYPIFRHKQFGEVIMQGDLVLCEMPAGAARLRRNFYQEKAQKQAALSAELAKGPNSAGGFHSIQVMENRKSVTTRKPITAADGG